MQIFEKNFSTMLQDSNLLRMFSLLTKCPISKCQVPKTYLTFDDKFDSHQQTKQLFFVIFYSQNLKIVCGEMNFSGQANFLTPIDSNTEDTATQTPKIVPTKYQLYLSNITDFLSSCCIGDVHKQLYLKEVSYQFLYSGALRLFPE